MVNQAILGLRAVGGEDQEAIEARTIPKHLVEFTERFASQQCLLRVFAIGVRSAHERFVCSELLGHEGLDDGAEARTVSCSACRRQILSRLTGTILAQLAGAAAELVSGNVAGLHPENRAER